MFVVGIFVSLLPAGMRRRWTHDLHLQWPCAVSAMLELIISASILAVRYPVFFEERNRRLLKMAIDAGGIPAMGGTAQGYGFALTSWIEYWMQPLSLFLVFLCAEGLGRLAAAFATESIWPSMLFGAPYYLMTRPGKKPTPALPVQRLERQPDGVSLRLYSTSPHPEWDAGLTFQHRGRIYTIVESNRGPGSWHTYLLRPVQEGWVVRKVLHWSESELQFL